MSNYLAGRIASVVLSLLVASIVIFLIMEVLPGDPAQFILGMNARPDTLAALRAQLGLDAPPLMRYFGWVLGMLHGDFGISYTYRVPVAELIGQRIGVSLPLAIFSLALTLLIAFPAGILAAAKRNSRTDLTVMGVTQFGVAVPNFWFAIILVLDLCGDPALVQCRRLPRLGQGLLAGHAAASSCRPSRWPCRRPRSSRASCARRCSTRLRKTISARLAPAASAGPRRSGGTRCATP